MIRILLSSVMLLLGACAVQDIPKLAKPVQPQPPVAFEKVAPILSTRCIACHSCLESPCGLNLQTFQGARRGAFHESAYNGLRLDAVAPQRMFEDAQTEQQWRDRGFVDVTKGEDESILMRAIRLSNLKRGAPTKTVRESLTCPQVPEQITASKADQFGMPYGLPALPSAQQNLLSGWIAGGAQGPAKEFTRQDLPTAIKKQIQVWEDFFNGKDLKQRIVSRYLFEHMFLAHLYLPEAPRQFYKLVRSSTACDSATAIPTRRPNDDPGKDMRYCLTLDTGTVVYKNHLPYEISAAKLAWLKKNFFGLPWTASRFPSWDDAIAGNPLVAYQDLPVEARYRFLLENAEYEVMTFIKGPVCNGSFAVNSIQEQFYVFFKDPKSELMIRYPDYARKIAKQLILPGDLGTDLSLLKIASGYDKIVKHRQEARMDLNRQTEKMYPKGLALSDIWDGDGRNDNAVLTVFRNDDNAKVYKGARGDLAKTAFVLDYSTFERLVYNLVINFDVFDNVSHQVLTRLYMEILRMDAEDNFLQFLPTSAREDLKREWYKGIGADSKLDFLKAGQFADIPQAIPLAHNHDAKKEFVRKILFDRLNAKTRGPVDTINWKVLADTKPADDVESQLRRIAAVGANKKLSPFPNFFPELSLLILTKNGQPHGVYSILRNREHDNLSWIIGESWRLSSAEDTLTILPATAGGYPNQFIVVEADKLPAMIDQILAIKDDDAYQKFAKGYAIERMDARMWSLYDFTNANLAQKEPLESGVLDLSRYNLSRER